MNDRLVRSTTAAALSGASALHVAWGHGSPFPYRTTAELTDNVVGSSRPPSPGACYTVALALAAAAMLTAIAPRTWMHRVALRAVASVFAIRAAFGFAGRTDLLVPGSTSPRFRQRDRRVYAPLCAILAAGITRSSRLRQAADRVSR